jgi:flagellar biosynthetic protein FliR
MLVTPTLAALDTPITANPLEFGMMAIGDLLIGMLLGLVMTLMFAAIQIGGQVMDMQAGFGLMNVFNPAFETQFPIYGFFFFILAVLYLLVSGGHILMIRALALTFESIPPGGLALGSDNLRGLMGMMSTWGTAMFYDGFLIAAPVAAAMMVAYVTMGIMGRVVPQIHMFVIGFPITIALSLFVVAFATSFYIRFLDGMFGRMWRNVETAISGMS